MNLKLKAFGKAAFQIMICGFVAVTTVVILRQLPTDWLPFVFGAAGVSFLFYIAYSINLTQLEYQQKLEEINKKA